MKLNTFNTSEEYLEQNSKYLERFPVINSLLLGLANRGEPGFYFDVVREQERLLSGIMMPARNLIIANEDEIAVKALRQLVDFFDKQSIHPPGIIAPKDICEAFIDLWTERKSCGAALEYNEMIYKADRVLQVKMPVGQIVIADHAYTSLISKWVFAFSVDAGLKEDWSRAQRIAKEKIAKKEFYLWMVGKIPVSMSAITRPTRNTISINSVYTPPEYRNQGYATACVHALTQKMLNYYSMVTLFTDLKNPTSNSIYQKIGYIPVEPFLQMRFIYA